MTVLEDVTAFDEVAHGIFDLVVPALIAWALAFGRKHLGQFMLHRTIKQAAGLGYAEMLRRGNASGGYGGIDGAINDAVNFVERHAVNPGDRDDIADLVRGELGALLASRDRSAGASLSPVPKP